MKNTPTSASDSRIRPDVHQTQSRDLCEPTRGGGLHTDATSWTDTYCSLPEHRWQQVAEEMECTG